MNYLPFHLSENNNDNVSEDEKRLFESSNLVLVDKGYSTPWLSIWMHKIIFSMLSFHLFAFPQSTIVTNICVKRSLMKKKRRKNFDPSITNNAWAMLAIWIQYWKYSNSQPAEHCILTCWFSLATHLQILSDSARISLNKLNFMVFVLECIEKS